MEKRSIVIAISGALAAVACIVSGYLSHTKTEPAPTIGATAESGATQSEQGSGPKGACSQEGAAHFPSEAEIRQSMLAGLREPGQAESAEPGGADVFRSALGNRLERRLGRPPSEEEFEEELRRLEGVVQRTDKDMFVKAKEGFEAIMAEGVADPDWTERTQEYLNEYLQHEGAQLAEVREVACTERVCRLRFEHESEEARARFSKEVAISVIPGMNGGDVFIENADSDGSVVTNAYVTWRGDQLILIDIRDAMDKLASAEQGSDRG